MSSGTLHLPFTRSFAKFGHYCGQHVIFARNLHLVKRVFFQISVPTQIRSEVQKDKIAFVSAEEFRYFSYCEDFGPISLATLFQFCSTINDKFMSASFVVITSPSDPKSLTNAVFLTGAYLMMCFDFELKDVKDRLATFFLQTVPFQDVSPGKQNFGLQIEDCWSGLLKAKQLGWVSFRTGGFVLDRYLHYDSPLNADLHEVVPGKLIAFRGPCAVPSDKLYLDKEMCEQGFCSREFSPSYYVDIFHHLNVQAVVRLNEPQYCADDFVKGGIAVADLPFDDCSPPPPDVVAAFLAIAEALPGALAVHCRAGLGRTGTLIALYMMKHHGFTAREAMGWLRIVRPGSVIGPQQQYLCDKEAIMHRAGEGHRAGERRRSRTRMLAAGAGVAEVGQLISDVQRRVHKAMARLTGAEADSVGPARPATSGGDERGVDTAARVSGSGAAAARELGAKVSAAAARRAEERLKDSDARLRRSEAVRVRRNHSF